MHTIKNKKRHQRTINLPNKSLYLGPRGKAVLTDEEFKSQEVQALIRRGYLAEVGGE